MHLYVQIGMRFLGSRPADTYHRHTVLYLGSVLMFNGSQECDRIANRPRSHANTGVSLGVVLDTSDDFEDDTGRCV
jgi:hypothetical protein